MKKTLITLTSLCLLTTATFATEIFKLRRPDSLFISVRGCNCDEYLIFQPDKTINIDGKEYPADSATLICDKTTLNLEPGQEITCKLGKVKIGERKTVGIHFKHGQFHHGIEGTFQTQLDCFG